MELNNKICNLLYELRETQNVVKEVKADLLRLAFEAGLDQSTALKINVADWLDGYLVAQGIVPEYRKTEATEFNNY